MKSMNELLLHFLQDIYDAERRGVKAFPKLIRAAQSDDVKKIITQHRDQSEQQIGRLDHVFSLLNKRPRGKACNAMMGLVAELEEAIAETEKGPVLDAALIAAAQAVEHYEIARYGTLLAWAKQIGMDEAAELFQQTLDEEKASDERLTALALGKTNVEAAALVEEEAAPAPTPRRGRGGRTAAPKTPEPPAPAPVAAAPAKAKTSRRKAAPAPEPTPEPVPEAKPAPRRTRTRRT